MCSLALAHSRFLHSRSFSLNLSLSPACLPSSSFTVLTPGTYHQHQLTRKLKGKDRRGGEKRDREEGREGKREEETEGRRERARERESEFKVVTENRLHTEVPRAWEPLSSSHSEPRLRLPRELQNENEIKNTIRSWTFP